MAEQRIIAILIRKCIFAKEIRRNWSDFRVQGLNRRKVMGLWEVRYRGKRRSISCLFMESSVLVKGRVLERHFYI